MKVIVLGAALLVAAFAPAMASQHVAVLSVDGLGAAALAPENGCLAADSTIRQLAKAGAWSSGVTGILPTVTYPTHATMVTGADPLTHGMIDNAARGVFWLKERKDIRADTLWDAAKRAGKTVAIVTWPSTYGADAAWLVPEDLAPRTNPQEDIRKGSTPGLFDALSAAVGAPALLHFGHADSGTPLDRMTGTFAAEIVKRHRPGLLLAHFLDYDHRMHAAPFTADDACKALARVDRWIAHIVEAYEIAGLRDRTTVFVVSDHGFLKVEQAINLGALLLEAGWKDVLGEAKLEDVFDLRIAGGSVALYPLEPQSGAWLERLRAHFRPRLEKAHGTRIRWLTGEQARAFGGFQDAAIVLCAKPGFSFRILPPSEVAVLVEPGRFLGAHGYCPDERAMDALFIASGPGVKAAGDIGRLHMRDVGATIAAVMGVKLRDATGTDHSARFIAPR